MSESLNAQTKPASTRGSSGDQRVLCLVEKWLETIREINREQAKN